MSKRALLEQILTYCDLLDVNICSIEKRLKSIESALKPETKPKTTKSKRSAAGKAKE